ncbi:hypothetical protein ACOSP7_005461 [Xanthoceras sorbifolium]
MPKILLVDEDKTGAGGNTSIPFMDFTLRMTDESQLMIIKRAATLHHPSMSEMKLFKSEKEKGQMGKYYHIDHDIENIKSGKCNAPKWQIWCRKICFCALLTL